MPRLGLVWLAGVAVGLTAEWVGFGWGDPRHWIPDLAVGWTFIGCGLVARARRPESRTGPLMAATGCAWFLGNFASVGAAAVAWVVAHLVYLHRGPLVHLVLTYPLLRHPARPRPGPGRRRRPHRIAAHPGDRPGAGGPAELRELAHGIYPAVLAEAGLAAALATLADAAPIPVEILALAEGRYPAAVESAAYLLVAEAVDDAAGRGASHAVVSAVRDGGWLAVTVEDDGTRRTSAMVQLADRVGALDGTLAVEPTRLRSELPCA